MLSSIVGRPRTSPATCRSDAGREHGRELRVLRGLGASPRKARAVQFASDMANPAMAPLPGDPRWDAMRGPVLRAFEAEAARLRGEMDRLLGFGDEAGAQRLENELLMLEIDKKAMWPPHLSDTGEFEPGDVRSYLRELGGQSAGAPSFDDLTPSQQREAILANASKYLAERGEELAHRAGQAALGGRGGDAFGQLLAMGLGGMVPWARSPRSSRGRRDKGCSTCHPPVNAEPHVTLYRGIQVRRGEPVQGTFRNENGGQMGSTNARDALHYGVNPVGRPPAGADEVVLIRVRVPASKLRDGAGAPYDPSRDTHWIIPHDTNIRELPGYREIRVPLRRLGGPPHPESGQRAPNSVAVDHWTKELGKP